MKTLQAGSATVAGWINEIAEQLFEDFPGDIVLLTGIVLPSDSSGQSAVLDFVAITATAAVIGIDVARELPTPVPPRRAGQRLLQLQESARLKPPLPVYVFWLEATGATQADEVPTLSDAARIQRYILQASAQADSPQPEVARDLSNLLLHSDVNRAEGRSETPPLRRVLRAIIDPSLFEIAPSKLGRRGAPLLPADVNRHLRDAMLEKHNLLEDVNYGKIVPNVYIVEINDDNYHQHYAPIEQQVEEQWRERLLEALRTANSRQGRKTYRFGGSVRIEIRPIAELAEHEVRIHTRIEPDREAKRPKPAADVTLACLEHARTGQRWPLRGDTLVIGRSAQSDVYLDDSIIQELRLVSSRHAHIRRRNDRYLIFDGSPDGKPSLNGTYVNGEEVTDSGYELYDGDLIILAALDPTQPRPETPGVAALRFRQPC